MSRWHRAVRASVALLSLWVSCVFADEKTDIFSPNRYQLYGFLTQGAFYARGNNYFGQNDGRLGFDFREVGLGGNYSLRPAHRVAGLLLSRNAGATDTGALRVDHLLLDSHWGAAGDWNFSSQLGKVKIPLALLNETRDVAATRPSILLPQGIYFDNARRYLINSQGVYAHASHVENGKSTTITLGVASPNGIDNPETEAAFLGLDHPGHLEAIPGYLFRVKYASIQSGLTALVQLSLVRTEYHPAEFDYLSGGELRIPTLHLSVEKYWSPIGFRSEFMGAKVKRSGFGPFIPDSANSMRSLYGELYYNGASTSLFVRYDASVIDISDRHGTTLAAATGRPNYDFFARDFTVGFRRDLFRRASLSFEYHYVDGTQWLTLADNPVAADHKRYWHILATQFTINF